MLLLAKNPLSKNKKIQSSGYQPQEGADRHQNTSAY